MQRTARSSAPASFVSFEGASAISSARPEKEQRLPSGEGRNQWQPGIYAEGSVAPRIGAFGTGDLHAGRHKLNGGPDTIGLRAERCGALSLSSVTNYGERSVI